MEVDITEFRVYVVDIEIHIFILAYGLNIGKKKKEFSLNSRFDEYSKSSSKTPRLDQTSASKGVHSHMATSMIPPNSVAKL